MAPLTPEQERDLRAWCDTKTEELLDALRAMRARPSVETARQVMLYGTAVLSIGTLLTLVALSHPERVAAACLIRGVTLAGPHDAPSGDAVVVYLAGDTPHDVADAWLARAKAHGFAIVFEADAGGRHPAALGYGDLTVTIGSIGLAHGMASWRLGYLAAPAAKAGPLRDFKQALTICSTNVSQWGALALESDLA